MRLPRHGAVHVVLALAVTATALLVAPPSARSAGATDGSQSDGGSGSGSVETTTRLTYDAPHVSASHDAGAGGWSFVVDGNRQVSSVRISVADGDCAAGGSTLWETKVTDDELKSGPVVREAGFAEGTYCSHLLLDGTKKASATVTTSVPERRAPEPEPTESPTAEPTATPTPEPTETPTPDPSTSPSPEPSAAPASAEYDRCSKDPKVDHRVLAGATGPDPEGPFIYQKFYPSTLQVHQGDLVEWCFNAGYDWHTVTFLPVDMDVALHPASERKDRSRIWRWDETGLKAFDENFLFGHEDGDEKRVVGDPKRKCGRGKYFHHAQQDPCELNSTEQKISSALWDRFFSIPVPGTFQTRINLEPGLYRYHCNIHSSMEGYIEVVPDDQTLTNRTPAEIDEEIAADYAEARGVFEELSDPSAAYNFEKRRWTVHVGAQTGDRSVAIEQFLPSRIEVRKGDKVHYVANTDEPNTVTFPGGRQFDGATLPTGHEIPGIKETDLQGGFSATGECGPHSCPTGRGAPWGMTGLAFLWVCDADGRSSGAPGSLPYVPSATASRTNGAVKNDGCVAGGLPEMIPLPWYGEQQRAAGDLVVTEKTFHNSGTILDASIPEWYRTWAADPAMPALRPAGEYPSTFDAKFPTSGTFKYFCAAHEFMNGVVVVKP